MWGVWLDLSCVHVYRPPLQSVQQAVAAGPRRTAQPAGQQRPASQPVSVFCNFLFLLLPHFLCIYVCVCPALDPDFTAISRASALVPLLFLFGVVALSHVSDSVPISPYQGSGLLSGMDTTGELSFGKGNCLHPTFIDHPACHCLMV